MQLAPTRSSQRGFTLVEIAIVLVIIGLILGGVLKGQELVTSARVRNIADQQNAMKAAFYAFQDRYKAVPGDYMAASTNIPGIPTSSQANGDGDGFVAYLSAPSVSANEKSESVWAFYHMAAAGFISCSQCMSSGGNTGVTPSISNSPTNVYGGAMALQYTNDFGDPSVTSNLANNLKSGSNIPSNILAEVDNKLDDGAPYSGSFQFSRFTAGTVEPTAASCVVAANANGSNTPAQWNRQTPSTNCGAAYLF